MAAARCAPSIGIERNAVALRRLDVLRHNALSQGVRFGGALVRGAVCATHNPRPAHEKVSLLSTKQSIARPETVVPFFRCQRKGRGKTKSQETREAQGGTDNSNAAGTEETEAASYRKSRQRDFNTIPMALNWIICRRRIAGLGVGRGGVAPRCWCAPGP